MIVVTIIETLTIVVMALFIRSLSRMVDHEVSMTQTAMNSLDIARRQNQQLVARINRTSRQDEKKQTRKKHRVYGPDRSKFNLD